MTVRTIVDWISFAETEGKPEAECSSCGGISAELTRADYIDGMRDEARAYVEAIWQHFDEHGAFGGFTHQESRCPVFDDGMVATYSYRGWGDVVAAWWNSRHPEAPTDYAWFAWEEAIDEAATLAKLTPDEVARLRLIRMAAKLGPDALCAVLGVKTEDA